MSAKVKMFINVCCSFPSASFCISHALLGRNNTDEIYARDYPFLPQGGCLQYILEVLE